MGLEWIALEPSTAELVEVRVDADFLVPSTTAATVGASIDHSSLILSSHQFHSKLKTFLFEESFTP